MALTELTKRTEQTPPLRQQQQSPDLMHEVADGLDFLIQQLAAAEDDRDAARTQSRTMDQMVAEQQKALLRSMQLMRRLEIEVGDLRSRVEGISLQPTGDELLPASATAQEAAPSKENVAALEEKVGLLETQLAAKNAEIEMLRQAQQKSSAAGPEAAMRVLEDQRDQARNEAESARADLSLQAAELQTKETVIETLEQALEQQHASLRGLEEKFAMYAAKLEELRLDRLQALNPSKDEDGAAEAARGGSGSPGALKRLFSRPKRDASTSIAVLSEEEEREDSKA